MSIVTPARGLVQRCKGTDIKTPDEAMPHRVGVGGSFGGSFPPFHPLGGSFPRFGGSFQPFFILLVGVFQFLGLDSSSPIVRAMFR